MKKERIGTFCFSGFPSLNYLNLTVSKFTAISPGLIDLPTNEENHNTF